VLYFMKDEIIANQQDGRQPASEILSAKDSFTVNGTHFVKDVNARTVFQNPVMCCQFLKEYSGIEMFKDIKPENIFDETEKYQAYLGITFESDTVNKIVLDDCYDVPVFLISLIEHKSRVDYNIAMQLLRYMVCIWNEYGKEKQERNEGNPANKEFMYPPIIPIVYYEGKSKWTVGLNLRDKISMNDVFAEYVPDFKYKLICNYNYTNDELLTREDEISLFMILNKVQTVEDMSAFLRLDDKKLNQILRKSPEHSIRIIADAMWSLCMKLNVPQEEAVDYVGRVWDRDMGYLFENIEKMDIQEERRKTKEAREALEIAERKADEAERKADEAERKADEAERKADEAERKAIEAQKALEIAKSEIELLKKQSDK